VIGDVGRRSLRRRAAELFDEAGNSLAFVHGKLNLVLAEMTGNRARIFLRKKARPRSVAGKG
jgi:hypothetical protein